MKNRGKARFFCVSSIVFITSGKEYGMVNLKSHHVLFAQLMLFDPGERVELKRLENKQRMNPRYTGMRRYISFVIKQITILEYFSNSLHF